MIIDMIFRFFSCTKQEKRLREQRRLVPSRPFSSSLRRLPLWYAPPVTVHRICKQLRFNICGENALRLKFARQYRFAAVPSKPPLAASRAVRGGFWLIAGLVPARPWLPGEPSISGSTEKKEETALEDKRLREQRGLVPARPFPTIRRRRSSGTLCRSSDRAAGCQRRSPQSPDSPRSVPHRPSRR